MRMGGRDWKINQRTGYWYTEGGWLEPRKEGWLFVKERYPRNLEVPTGEHNAKKAAEFASTYWPPEEAF